MENKKNVHQSSEERETSREEESKNEKNNALAGGSGWRERIPSLHFPMQDYLPEGLTRIWRSKEREIVRVRPEVAVNSEMQNYCLDLLHGACLPLETISHVFAYGSGAIPQKGEDTREKMVDFLIVCNDSEQFHRRNVLLNPDHYCSWLRRLNAEWLDRIQRLSGARIYYNTRIYSKGRLIKYGVIHSEDLETDLLDWTWLYAAGRLQKPVLEVFSVPIEQRMGRFPGRDINRALYDNYRAAVHTALLQLDGWFTMDQFLTKVVAISYTGDIRRNIGAEDPRKVEKIVAGAASQLRAIYLPILTLDRNVQVHADDKIEQDCSTPTMFFRLTQLPRTVLERLSKSYYPLRRAADTEELLYPISHRHDLDQHFSTVIRDIVQESSLKQSLKNFFTAGPLKSFLYVVPKFLKRIKVSI